MPYKDPEKRRAYDKARQGKWAREHPEEARAYQRRYAKANRAKQKAARRALYQADPARHVQYTLRHKAKPGNRERINKHQQCRRYGITPDEYDRLFAQQNGLCGICKQPETHRTQKRGPVNRLSVDHCHKSDRVRGLLCHHCNAALGLLNDDAARLRDAADYIERHERSDP